MNRADVAHELRRTMFGRRSWVVVAERLPRTHWRRRWWLFQQRNQWALDDLEHAFLRRASIAGMGAKATQLRIEAHVRRWAVLFLGVDAKARS